MPRFQVSDLLPFGPAGEIRALPVLLLWNPLLAAVLVLGFGRGDPRPLGVQLLASFSMFTWASLIYLGVRWGSLRARWAWLRRSWRVARPAEPGLAWNFLLLCLVAYPATEGAYRVSKAIFGALELPCQPMSGSQMAFSIVFGVGAFAILFLVESWRDAGRVREQLERERARNQMILLRSQLNPHFLFNALNGISSLVATQPAKAEAMIQDFSELLRAMLLQDTWVSLEEELELCRLYLAIQKARFGSRLETAWSVPNHLDPRLIRVPTLVLQPLIENSIKHAIQGSAEGGRISIGARLAEGGRELELAVEDEPRGEAAGPAPAGAGVGLANVRERLELLFGTGAAGLTFERREPRGSRARVRLPLGSAGAGGLA